MGIRRANEVLHLRSRRLAPHASSAHSAVPALLAAGFVFARHLGSRLGALTLRPKPLTPYIKYPAVFLIMVLC